MNWELDICGDEAIHFPELEECNECDVFEERLTAIEQLLEGFSRTEIAMTDGDGLETTATIAAHVQIASLNDDNTDSENSSDSGSDDGGADD